MGREDAGKKERKKGRLAEKEKNEGKKDCEGRTV